MGRHVMFGRPWVRVLTAFVVLSVGIGFWIAPEVVRVASADPVVVATVPVGASPRHVALNAANRRAYVTNLDSNTVSVIDTASNSVIATVPAGFNPYGVAVNLTTGRV